MTPQANAYIAVMRKIPGWLTVNDAAAICAINTIQTDLTTSGAIIEVGVYHGMSLGLLQTLTPHPVIAVDQFTEASIGTVIDHLIATDVGGRPCFIRGSSHNPAVWAAVDETKAVFRFAHLDAGHEYADVYADLLELEKRLLPAGVIAVDDYFDKDSPGVALATRDVCGVTDLQPFLCGENKMFLCRSKYLVDYLQGALCVEPFRSHARIQTLPCGPLLVGFPNKPHERVRMVAQIEAWDTRS